MLWLTVLSVISFGKSFAFLISGSEFNVENDKSSYYATYSVHEDVVNNFSAPHYGSRETINNYGFIELGEANGALLLTPYIEQGNIEEGREAARVQPLLGDIKSYSGFFTVNKQFHSNLFFWYFPAESGKSAPVILWLNGGPGESSLFGLLLENGPPELADGIASDKRQIYWSKHYHMIYIDNPVGVGYSFTDNGGLPHNESDVSSEMHSAIIQFFQIFPELSRNDFYVAGESYAGRYIPCIAHRIHMMNPSSMVHINLKGVMIGNGMVDVEFMNRQGQLLAQLGLMDRRKLPERLAREEVFRQALASKDYKKAKEVEQELIIDIQSLDVDMYNILKHTVDRDSITEAINKIFNNPFVRYPIHVGNVNYRAFNYDVWQKLMDGDLFMRISPYVEHLLEHYRVLYYNGQFDMLLPYVNCEEYLDTLEWSGASEYRRTPRERWIVGGKTAGFSRAAGNLTSVLVRDAGHMVPQDQPEWALDLITKFTRNQPIV